MDILVRSKLYDEDDRACDSRRCSPSDKSRCQVCKVMCSTTQFRSNVTDNEFVITFSFQCDLSNVVYLLECSDCGLKYVGSTCTLFGWRFNRYKAYNHRFLRGELQECPRLTFSGTLLGKATEDSWKT